GKQIRGQHRENNGFGERYEQVAGYAGEEEHRHEHDTDRESGDKSGDGDFLRTIQDSLDGLFAHGEVPVDVLDCDGRVIDQNTYGKGKTAEGHNVNGLPDRTQNDDGRQNRQWNRDSDNQRAAPASQKHQDHEPGKACGNNRFPDNPIDGGADEHGLVRDGADAQFWRQGGKHAGQRFLNFRDDIKRGGIARFQHRHQRSPLPIHVNDIRLRRVAVADMRDIANIDRIGADGFNRQIIQFLDGLGTTVEVHVVFERADFYRAGGQNQVLSSDRVHHIVRG